MGACKETTLTTEEMDESKTGRFMTGLLIGSAVGAGLALLFAPRKGAELRGQITSRATALGELASKRYRQVAQVACDATKKGAALVEQTRGMVARTTGETKRYLAEVQARLRPPAA